ncbi:hypothetical protein ACJJTC_008386 [Scirpophaga incertulas]
MAAPTDPKAVININKTETEYNMRSIRFLLLTITSMFIVIGILMMVLGTSVYSSYHSFSFVYQSAKAGGYLTPSVMCVFIGFFLIVISSFGFFGSLKRSTCLVNSLNCCGSQSYLDYADVNFNSNHSTVVVSESHLESILIPESCCASIGEVACLWVRPRGCIHGMIDFVAQNARVLGVMGVSIMFILLLGIIFALLLARSIRKLEKRACPDGMENKRAIYTC